MKLALHELLTQCPEAWYELLAAGKIADGAHLEGDENTLMPLLARCSKSVKDHSRVHLVASNHPEWPKWAQTIAGRRKAHEAGVGDTAERLFGHFGGGQFKAAMKELGMDCGCAARKEQWNTRFSYTNLTTETGLRSVLSRIAGVLGIGK